MHRLLKGSHSWVAGEARQPWRQCCHRLRTQVRRTQSSLCPSDIEWVKSRISGLRKALLRIVHVRDNVGQPEFVFWFHNSTMINFQPGVTVETALIGSQSQFSLIVSLFSFLGNSKDVRLAWIYNLKTNVSEMLICCFEREAGSPSWTESVLW